MNSDNSSGVTGTGPTIHLSPPQQALWWLKKGGFKLGPEWDKAHAICQTAEGTFEYDLVHALAHWIEGGSRQPRLLVPAGETAEGRDD